MDTNNSLTEQIKKLQQILFTRSTAIALGQSLRLLLSLIKESSLLVWLILCWGLVAVSWLSRQAVDSGRSLKIQATNLRETYGEQTPAKVVVETSRSIVGRAKGVLTYAIAQAKKQVGLHDQL